MMSTPTSTPTFCNVCLWFRRPHSHTDLCTNLYTDLTPTFAKRLVSQITRVKTLITPTYTNLFNNKFERRC